MSFGVFQVFLQANSELEFFCFQNPLLPWPPGAELASRFSLRRFQAQVPKFADFEFSLSDFGLRAFASGSAIQIPDSKTRRFNFQVPRNFPFPLRLASKLCFSCGNFAPENFSVGKAWRLRRRNSDRFLAWNFSPSCLPSGGRPFCGNSKIPLQTFSALPKIPASALKLFPAFLPFRHFHKVY